MMLKKMCKGFCIMAGALFMILITPEWEPSHEQEVQTHNEIREIEPSSDLESSSKEEEKPRPIGITISAAGDCTLGTDKYFNPKTSFVAKFNEVNDPGYFFANVKPIFEADDLTIVNLEGTLTEETHRQDKKFAFKGEPSYVHILTQGSVEAVNFANNHTKDYGEQSYEDTLQALKQAGIRSFGYDNTIIMDIKGIKVGLLGLHETSQKINCKDALIKNMKALKEQGAQLIIASFHWGIERDHYPNDVQKTLARLAIDHGADLVLGHHPHVLQGIEIYKNKNIVYSLANFCFGGNSNPPDKDTMIFQQTFTFEDGALAEDNVSTVIPCTVSSTDKRNNYQPTPAQGERKEKILQRISKYSSIFRKESAVESAS